MSAGSATRWSTARRPRSVTGPTSSSCSSTFSPGPTTRGSPPRPGWPASAVHPRTPPRSPEKKAAKLARKFGTPEAPPTVIPYMQLPVEDREKVIGPSTDERGTLTEPRSFNLMFKTFVGALESDSNVAYLRPETAQGIFANFKNVVDTGRVKVPFGIAQVGKSFRNEINPRNFTFRSREFEQMEIEFFCHPDEADRVVRLLAQGSLRVVRRPRPAVRPPPPPRPRPGRAGLLLDRHGRHRVRVPVRHQRAGGHRPPRRLRPDPAQEVQRQGPQLLRRGPLGARQGDARA